jgi:hypothetical protein
MGNDAGLSQEHVWTTDAILQMLNFNVATEQPSGGTQQLPAVWKVLVYDRLGQEIISPLLKVNELRENNVTVHLPLVKERFPIPDVPAVYFVEPTQENMKRIAQVCFPRHLMCVLALKSIDLIPLVRVEQ